MLLEKTAEKKGFGIAFKNENFKCAFIKHSSEYSFGKVLQMKRHNETDEIFILLNGIAVMLTMENGKFFERELEKNIAYNVKRGTWHYLAVSKNAKVFVTENSDTNSSNSDILNLDKAYAINER